MRAAHGLGFGVLAIGLGYGLYAAGQPAQTAARRRAPLKTPARLPASPPASAPQGPQPAPRVVRETLAEVAGLVRVGAYEEAARVVRAALTQVEDPAPRAALLERLESLSRHAGEPTLGPAPLGPLDAPPPDPEPRPVDEGLPAGAQALAAAEVEDEPPSPEPPRPDPKPEPLRVRAPFPARAEAERAPRAEQDLLLREVERAIAQGVENLELRSGQVRRSGEVALCAFALLRSGVSARGRAVEGLFEALRRSETNDTYDLAVSIMALEAASLVRTGGPSAGGTAPRYARQALPANVRDEVAALARQLVAGQTAQGDWSYTCPKRQSGTKVGKRGTGTLRGAAFSGGTPDNSNTQFAVLGLHAAQRCGVEVPSACWRKVFDHFSTTVSAPQPADPVAIEWTGARPPVLLPGEAQGTRVADPEGTRTGATQGWGYRRGSPPKPSMTAAGLSSLVISANALLEARRLERAEQDAVGAIARGAMTALAEGLGAERLFGAEGWHYYMLYSLEKAMDVSGVASLDHVDWWRACARDLARAQRADGGWGTPVDTSFALLVLNRATLSLGPETRVRGGTGPADPLKVKVGKERVDLPLLLHEVAKGGDLRRDLSLLRRAFKALPKVHRAILSPRLAELLEVEDAATRRFAKKALRQITGESLEPEGYAAWGRDFVLMHEAAAPLRPDEVAATQRALRTARDGPLLRAAATAAVRGRLVSVVPDLIAALGRAPSAETHGQLNSALRLLTAADPAAELSEQREISAAWAAWLATHRDALARRVLVVAFVTQAPEADAARAALLELGEEAVLDLLDAFVAYPQDARIPALLEALTGLRPDATPEAWREALAVR
ncbi:MAG: hypothetical protein KDD82_15255 [Planctomycetes bacterium]|nr:hypothetical protein [Planctomycetota bacterium]